MTEKEKSKVMTVKVTRKSIGKKVTGHAGKDGSGWKEEAQNKSYTKTWEE